MGDVPVTSDTHKIEEIPMQRQPRKRSLSLDAKEYKECVDPLDYFSDI